MEIVAPDGRVEERPLNAWEGLVAEGMAGKSRNREALIRLTISDPWLAGLEAQFMDTPGVNDIDARRAALVVDTLSRSDGAVVVVSALQPLSRTEAAFVEQQVLGQRVARAFVVVSASTNCLWNSGRRWSSMSGSGSLRSPRGSPSCLSLLCGRE